MKIMVDYHMKFVGLNPLGERIRISEGKGFDYIEYRVSKS